MLTISSVVVVVVVVVVVEVGDVVALVLSVVVMVLVADADPVLEPDVVAVVEPVLELLSPPPLLWRYHRAVLRAALVTERRAGARCSRRLDRRLALTAVQVSLAGDGARHRARLGPRAHPLARADPLLDLGKKHLVGGEFVGR